VGIMNVPLLEMRGNNARSFIVLIIIFLYCILDINGTEEILLYVFVLLRLKITVPQITTLDTF
jgi:hypothetical protein